jgi:hypothetical protein
VLTYFPRVAERPGFLAARLITTPGGRQALSVKVSIAIDDDDEWLNPVRDFLLNRQHQLLFREVVDDESMMFGEAVYSVYVLEGSI